MGGARGILPMAWVLCVWAGAAGAGEAEEAFNTIFGAEYKKVLATGDRTDDVALARKLLTAARAPGTHPDLGGLLCEKAYELGLRHPTGLPTAAEAMEQRASTLKDAGRKAECLDRLVAVRQRLYNAPRPPDRSAAGEALVDALADLAGAEDEAGKTTEAVASIRRALPIARALKSDRKDDLQAKLDRLAARQAAQTQVARLKTRLQATPTDQAVRRELVRLLVVDLDDPNQAAGFLDASCDESMRTYVPTAAKGVDAAPEALCLELANWYRSLEDKAGPAGKVAVMIRAFGYCRRFLSLHPTEDVPRNQASMLAKQLDDAIAQLGGGRADGTVPGPWIDLLRMVNLAQHAAAGQWQRIGGALHVSDQGIARLSLPCAPEGDYELSITFARLKDSPRFGVILPVAGKSLPFAVEKTGGAVHPDGRARGEKLWAFEPELGRPHILAVQVTAAQDKARIEATMDDKPYFRWEGDVSAIQPPDKDYALPDPQRLGLGTNWSALQIARIRLRMLRGRARMIH